MPEIRCVGCGKTISDGEEVVRIAEGTWQDGNEFEESRQWGTLHKNPCFVRSVTSPQLMLAEVRKLARRRKSA